MIEGEQGDVPMDGMVGDGVTGEESLDVDEGVAVEEAATQVDDKFKLSWRNGQVVLSERHGSFVSLKLGHQRGENWGFATNKWRFVGEPFGFAELFHGLNQEWSRWWSQSSS